jgi:hypothetical protein
MTTSVGVVIAQDSCPETRLAIGESGRVTPGTPNNVRDEPATSGVKVGEIPGGGRFSVLDGPICSEGYLWWQVDYAGVTGWTVEASGDDYYVEPIAPVAPPIEPGVLPDREIGTVTVTFSGGELTFSCSADDDMLSAVETAAYYDPEGPYWGNAPQHLSVSFSNCTGDDEQGDLVVYLTETTPDAGDQWVNRLAEMETFLQDLPTQEDFFFPPPDELEVPFMPMLNSDQVIYPYFEPLTFDGGSGVRYVTTYSQDITPVFYEYLYYHFIGLSDDGRYVVSARIPVISEAEPTVDPLTVRFSYDDPSGHWGYLVAETLNLNESPESIKPSLDALDTMIESIRID